MELPAALILVLLFLVASIWVPMELFHKAGYSRWWGLLILPSGFFGLIVFAMIEWPVHRELAWRRLAAGSFSESDVTLANSYAVHLEMKGDWNQAIEVYETLADRASDKQDAEYATNCIVRLRRQQEDLELA